MLKLYLIRHGQSTNNIEPNFEKHSFDPPLTQSGVQQAQALANHLKFACDDGAMGYGYNIQQIYTSPQMRALQTAQPIANTLDIRPKIWVTIHERGGVAILHRGGIHHHHGLIRSEITTQFPTFKIPYQITESGWWKGKSGLESHDDVALRARVVAKDLLVKSGTSRELRIALISHGTFLNSLMQFLLGDDSNKFLHHNGGISRIDIDRDSKSSLVYLNRTLHLTQHWVS